MTIQELYNLLYQSPYDAFQNLSGTAWDYSTGRLKTKTLTANTSITLSNGVNGAMWGQFLVLQDATGGRTLTLFGDSIPINSTANAATDIGFVHDGTRFHYYVNQSPLLGAAADVTPPTVTNRATGSTTTIVITLSENVTATNIGWSFKKNGSAYTPTGISGSGTNQLTFTFGSSMISTDVLLCSYNSGTGDCKDTSNNPLASFTDQSVTNGLGSTTLNAPVLSTPTVVGSTELDLSWTDTNSSPNETNFQLERSPDGSTSWTTINSPAANVTSYNNTGLTASTQYFYRIKAVGDGGVTTNDSVYSNIVNATTSSGVIDLTFTSKDAGITESPAHTFTGTSGNMVSDQAMAGDGYVMWDMSSDASVTSQCAFGLDDNSTRNAYTTPWKFAAYNDGAHYVTLDNSGTPVSTGTVAANGDQLKLIRTGTTVKLQLIRSGVTSDLFTYSTTSSASLYAKASFPVSGRKLINPKGSGMA